MREVLRLDSQCYTPRARRKAVHAGGMSPSNKAGAKALQELAEWNLNATRVSELTVAAGREMKQQQTARVEAFHQREAKRLLTEPRQQPATVAENAPQVGVVEMDGGRIRTRQADAPRGVTQPHWREFQAGCVVRLQSEATGEDPRPEIPSLFLNRPRVQKLVTQLHRQRGAAHDESDPESNEESIGEILAEANLAENAGEQAASASECSAPRAKRNAPVRLMRTCVATLEGADACGRVLAAEAAERGLNQAPRKAFVGDGQSCNWSVWERYFKPQGYLAVLDFIHLLSYVYALAMAVGRNADDGWRHHVQWVTALWNGRAAEVLQQWQSLARQHNIPPDTALPDNDPRRPIQRGVTYLTNNLARVDYPQYRRLGLPVTSTLVESLVKEYNLRVKGTEKFWTDPQGAEAILTVRSALLSEDERFDKFFAQRPGCRYRRRSTLEREQQSQAPHATAG